MNLGRIVLLVAILMSMFGDFPPWAEWLGLGVVLLLLIWEIGKWAYVRYYETPRTYVLRITSPLQKTIEVGPSGAWIGMEIRARRAVSITKARICLSDRHNGAERPTGQKELMLTEVSDGCSPSQISDESIKRSFSRLELWCGNDPILVDPVEPLQWSVLVECQRRWTGYLVFVGWDENANRQHASVKVSLTPAVISKGSVSSSGLPIRQ